MFSQRTEDWGASMNLMGIVRTAVRRMLRNTIANPFMLNAYEDAMVEYCMAFQHNHNRERDRAWAGIGVGSSLLSCLGVFSDIPLLWY